MSKKKKINEGDIVDYHSVIGGPITSNGHKVLATLPTPNNYGMNCAMITGKSGVVNMDSLTHREAGENRQLHGVF